MSSRTCATRPASEIVEQYLDARRARDELSWTPVYDFDEGLRRTVAWYREFLSDRQPIAR